MPKQRKTREQKIAADMRHEHTEHVRAVTFSLPSSYKIQSSPITISQSFLHQKDLQKTLLVSSAIIILQILLFVLLKHHIVVMPFASLQY